MEELECSRKFYVHVARKIVVYELRSAINFFFSTGDFSPSL